MDPNGSQPDAGLKDAEAILGVPQPRFFSSSPEEKPLRRASDLLLAVACETAVVGLILLSPTASQTRAATAELAGSLPGVLRPLWALGCVLLGLWSLFLLIVAAVRPGRRVLVLHCLLGAVLSWLAVGAVVALKETGADAGFAAGPVAFMLCAAIVVTASPHLVRPYRRIGRLLLAWAALSLMLLGVAAPVTVAVALLAGTAGAAVAHLAVGSPGGRPTVKHVRTALAELGVPVLELRESRRQVPGESRFQAKAPDGSMLAVAVLGRDAWDRQFLVSIWTALWRRGERPRINHSRSSLVEHEAMVTLLAQRAGVPVPPLTAVGTSSDGDAVIVTGSGGMSLREVDAGEVTDQVLREAWQALCALHDIGISHRNIDPDRLALRDGGVALVDLGDATLPGDPRDMLSDRARLLTVCALISDPDRGVDAALSVLGREGLMGVLPYVQPPVVGVSMRRDVRDREWDLGVLRAKAAAACGVPAPELEPVQRISARSLAASALFVVLTWALVSWLLTLDFAALWSALMDADWALLGLALCLSPMIQPGLALSTLGTSGARLRYGPTLMLEYAIQFVSLTLPSAAARVGVQVQFFRRFGIAPASAVTMGLLDSFSGFAVQVILILVVLLADLPGFTTQVLGGGSSGTEDSSDPWLIMFVLVALVAGLVVGLVVPPTRRRLLRWVALARRSAHEQVAGATDALAVLRRPGRVSEMVGGNLMAQLLAAIILGVCLRAFGHSATMSQLVLINTVVCLFGGLMPVPGNIGVAEAGYTLGLRAIGIPSAEAVSVAIAFRLVTFYLPPLWGGPAFHWLRHRSYL